jgi:hypothetical protein
MVQARRRRHEQFAADQLVSRRNEWRGSNERAHLARGPATGGFRGHGHSLVRARQRGQRRMPNDADASRRERSRTDASETGRMRQRGIADGRYTRRKHFASDGTVVKNAHDRVIVRHAGFDLSDSAPARRCREREPARSVARGTVGGPGSRGPGFV